MVCKQCPLMVLCIALGQWELSWFEWNETIQCVYSALCPHYKTKATGEKAANMALQRTCADPLAPHATYMHYMYIHSWFS